MNLPGKCWLSARHTVGLQVPCQGLVPVACCSLQVPCLLSAPASFVPPCHEAIWLCSEAVLRAWGCAGGRQDCVPSLGVTPLADLCFPCGSSSAQGEGGRSLKGQLPGDLASSELGDRRAKPASSSPREQKGALASGPQGGEWWGQALGSPRGTSFLSLRGARVHMRKARMVPVSVAGPLSREPARSEPE